MNDAQQEIAAHKQFMLENWDELAAAAWAGYKEQGRGFLFILRANVNVFPGAMEMAGFEGGLLPGVTRVLYVSRRFLKQAGLTLDDFPPEAEQYVRQYRPEVEIVLLIERSDGESIYRYAVNNAPGPPVAYHRLKDQLHWVAGEGDPGV